MSAADVALLAERHMTGSQPGEEVYQVPERHRAQPRAQHPPAAPETNSPPRAPRSQAPARRSTAPPAARGRARRHEPPSWPGGTGSATRSRTPAGASAGPGGGHWLSGISPPLRRTPAAPRPPRAAAWPGAWPGSPRSARAAASVAWSTTCLPAGVIDTSTARRSARARCRRISPLRTSRSHIRPAVDGATPSAAARSTSRCGPPRRQHHQRPVLRDRGLLGRRAQRPGGHRYQRRLAASTPSTAPLVHRVHAPSRFLCNRQYLHLATIAHVRLCGATRHWTRPGVPVREQAARAARAMASLVSERPAARRDAVKPWFRYAGLPCRHCRSARPDRATF